MTYRDDDDDTSAGRTTQGGWTARSGKSIWWLLGALVIAAAVAFAVFTLPHKRAPAEEGTAPVSSTMNTTAPSSAAPASPTAAPAH